jgi:hypothetical protein
MQSNRSILSPRQLGFIKKINMYGKTQTLDKLLFKDTDDVMFVIKDFREAVDARVVTSDTLMSSSFGLTFKCSRYFLFFS